MKPTSRQRKRKPEFNGLDWDGVTGLSGGRIVTGHGGINKCLDFMAKEFCRPIQIKDLVKQSGMSSRGFSKAFENHVGAAPGSYLRRLRLEKARRILIRQDLKLREIARLCGYRSENTFCVAFQRSLGIAPKQFQRQYLLASNRRLR